MTYALRHLLSLLPVLLLPTFVLSQAPTEQPAHVNTAISANVSLLKITPTGFQVFVSYISHLKEPIHFTLTYPPEKAGFAVDNLGNEYVLINATGMTRRAEDPNIDLLRPELLHVHSTFLLAPPEMKVYAAFAFKRITTRSTETTEQPTSVNLSISHYARPAENFDLKQPTRAFGFTTTITNVKPD